MLKPVHISKQEAKSFKSMALCGLFGVVYFPVKYLSFPFADYLRFMVLKLFCRQIHCTYISDGVTLAFPWRIKIGAGSSLNQGTIIDGMGGVEIGEGVRIAPYVMINTADHEFNDPDVFIKDQGFSCAAVTIEDDVWLGAKACVNKGVTIGKGAVIGAGAVVTKDIPAYSVAVGVPAKVVGERKTSVPEQK